MSGIISSIGDLIHSVLDLFSSFVKLILSGLHSVGELFASGVSSVFRLFSSLLSNFFELLQGFVGLVLGKSTSFSLQSVSVLHCDLDEHGSRSAIWQ